jgi:hypothetical protein
MLQVKLVGVSLSALKKMHYLGNGLIIICLFCMCYSLSVYTLYLAGIVANFVVPVQRTYGRMLAERIKDDKISSADLLSQGVKIIRAIHILLIVMFPICLQFGSFKSPIFMSCLAIVTLLMTSQIFKIKEKTHDIT